MSGTNVLERRLLLKNEDEKVSLVHEPAGESLSGNSNVGTCTNCGEVLPLQCVPVFTFQDLIDLDICQESIGPFGFLCRINPILFSLLPLVKASSFGRSKPTFHRRNSSNSHSAVPEFLRIGDANEHHGKVWLRF